MGPILMIYQPEVLIVGERREGRTPVPVMVKNE